MTRKYDHTAYSTKDVADSLAGSYLDASKYKDEFLFFNPREYQYEELNDHEDYEDKAKKELVASLLGSKLSRDSLESLFDRDDEIPYYDSNILTL